VALRIDLAGTVAIVTGASRGLGRVLALALAEAGADLALAARGAAALEGTAEEARAHGVRAEPFPTDLRQDAEIGTLVDRTVAAFGRVDVLVNNAGISGSVKPFVDVGAAEWDEVMAVNLRAPALCAQAAARHMMARRRGRIINVASIGGLTPISRLAAYCTSKAGLIQLTRVLALELARYDVQVNAICPGYFRTPMNEAFFAAPAGQEVIRRSIPMRRLGEPAELAPTVVLMASGAASFMTGSVVVVDGGHTLT
jgi:2-deoxy-D-gluconate 3-dehydrogenase